MIRQIRILFDNKDMVNDNLGHFPVTKETIVRNGDDEGYN